MTTSWLGQFLPQISIYNRILPRLKREEEKTQLGALIRACIHWTSPNQKQNAGWESHSKSFGDPRGEQRESKVVTVLFSLPTEDQFSLQWTKACSIKICSIFKGKRKDTYLTPPSSQNLCTMPVPLGPLSGTNFCRWQWETWPRKH